MRMYASVASILGNSVQDVFSSMFTYTFSSNSVTGFHISSPLPVARDVQLRPVCDGCKHDCNRELRQG
jgi:hypothetical protein